MKASHEEELELAKIALQKIAVEQRDFSSLSVVLNSKNLKRAKELVRKFRNEFIQSIENEDSEGEDVYTLCLQLFPLTRIQNE